MCGVCVFPFLLASQGSFVNVYVLEITMPPSCTQVPPSAVPANVKIVPPICSQNEYLHTKFQENLLFLILLLIL